MKRILEIGGGTTPYFIRYDISWMHNDSYICLDIKETALEKARSAIREHAQRGKAVPLEAEYILADAVRLPFENESIDEIYVSNVLSAPIHYAWENDGKYLKVVNMTETIARPTMRHEGDLFYSERKPVVDEALRVLKPGGKLHIYTDLLIYGYHSYDRLLTELKNNLSLIPKEDKEEAKRIDQLNNWKRTSGEYCFCFTADVLPESSVVRFTKLQ